MKKVIKKIAVLTAAGATAAAMAITASAAVIDVSKDFYVAGIKCTGQMKLDPYSIILTTSAESDSGNFDFVTSAQYQYYDSNGVLRNGSKSGGGTLSFPTPGSSPMCSYIFCTHRATYKIDGSSNWTTTQYGTKG